MYNSIVSGVNVQPCGANPARLHCNCRLLVAIAAALLAYSFWISPKALATEPLAQIKLSTGAVSDFEVLPDGKIVVSNLDLNLLDVYSAAGNKIRSLKPPVDSGDFFRPGAIALEGKTGFWVVDYHSGRVLRYLSDGNLLSSFPLKAGSSELRSIAAIAIAPARLAPKIAAGHTDAEGESPETLHILDEGEGRLFVLRADGVISAFDFSGKNIFDLPAPARIAVHTPAGIYLDSPLVWSLDYESKRVSIYDLERRDSPPGVVPLKGIPSGFPICGLAGLPGESLIVVLSGPKPVWAESDDGWKSLIDRKPGGAQPPIVKISGGKIYLLDRDLAQIEVYPLEV